MDETRKSTVSEGTNRLLAYDGIVESLIEVSAKAKPAVGDAVVTDNDMELCGLDQLIYVACHNRGIRRNEIDNRFYDSDGKVIDDSEINTLVIACRAAAQESGVRYREINPTSVGIVLNSLHTPTFNPLLDYFDRIRQLPLKRGSVDKLLSAIYLVDHHPEFKERFLKKWLGGIVGSAYGIYSLLCLVLIGKQGIGKSKFFRGLLPPELQLYYAEGGISDDKDTWARMCDNLILHDDEFTSKSKTEASVFKKLVSAVNFTYRPPYGRSDITRRRIAVLCGSANESDVVSDHTGNRRIIPARVSKIDHEALAQINLDDVYRELIDLYEQDPEWWYLTPADIELLNNDTEQNTAVCPFEAKLLLWTEPDEAGHVSTSEVERHIAARDWSYRANPTRMGKAMTRVYGLSARKRVGGTTIRGYKLRLLETPKNESK